MKNEIKIRLLWIIINYYLLIYKINSQNYNEWKFKNLSNYKKKTFESKRKINKLRRYYRGNFWRYSSY